MPQINLEYPLWFLVFCLLVGAGYAWLLYSKTPPWSVQTNRLLTVGRFVVVALLTFLLLNPLLRQIISTIEKPVYVIAVDNSSSILNSSDSVKAAAILKDVDGLRAELSGEGYDVELRTLTKTVAQVGDINFDEKATDINGLLSEIQSVYEGRNLSGALLVSDGNYNQGVSPAYFPYNFKVFTLGIGDTTRKEDIILKSVFYNRIAYQGNKFPVRVEVLNQGMVGSSTRILIKQRGKVIASETVTFQHDNALSVLDFSIEAVDKGVQRYTVEVSPRAGESITTNNYKQIFVDVIEGKQRILLVGTNVHPDIKALRSVIGSNDNYEFDHFIPGVEELKNDKYDLVIVHQAYDVGQRTTPFIRNFQKEGVPILYILGKQTNVVIMSTENDGFNFKMVRNQTDLVGPSYNDAFSRFRYNQDHNAIIAEFPPVRVPYGDYSLTPDAEVLLYQKVGSITTGKPLVYVTENPKGKAGYIVGDGFWQWRMQEYALTEKTEAFDELFLKLIQYLSTKEDKRKFKLFTTKNEYFDNESVQFQAEIYNDIYERIYGNEVELTITNEDGFKETYTFSATASDTNFKLEGLEEGVYQYRGITKRGTETEIVNGRFTVRKLQLELLDQSADFGLLREISKNTKASFFLSSEIESLKQTLSNVNARGVMHSQEEFSSLINLKWIFFLLLTLVSAEWFTRKYSGGY